MNILALDLGKSKTVGCILDTESNTTAYVTIKSVPFAVHDVLERRRPDRVVMEVGPMAGWVCDIVADKDLACEVANVNHEAWRWRNVKRKTDRLDALKLAQLSAAGQLPLVYMPSPSVRQHRSVIHYRCKLVSRRTRIKNTIRSLLHAQSLPMPAGAAGWTQRSLATLARRARPLAEVDAAALWRGQLHEELEALASVEAQLKRVESKLDALGRADSRIRRLQTIPCVGPRTAEMLVAVIDDPGRFASGREVGSYLGLTPRQYQSGQIDRHGGISKQGHRQLRRMLVEVSWLALRYNPSLRAVYERVCRGSVSRRKIAIVAVARKLAVIAWAMLRDRTTWQPSSQASAA